MTAAWIAAMADSGGLTARCESESSHTHPIGHPDEPMTAIDPLIL
ncbi:hypothetical protein D805_1386 [Bifidobacterium thermophilum RBL67]|uniref:Uncharacterized protein n=1 Tax=Bifidobacterium thermophilum RBL67 TaxID=1254439 RepID=M4RGG4_9BIFI|nr:hypothetical protein D805_1386 [Bifidobacterium thermophilum RBL67]